MNKVRNWSRIVDVKDHWTIELWMHIREDRWLENVGESEDVWKLQKRPGVDDDSAASESRVKTRTPRAAHPIADPDWRRLKNAGTSFDRRNGCEIRNAGSRCHRLPSGAQLPVSRWSRQRSYWMLRVPPLWLEFCLCVWSLKTPSVRWADVRFSFKALTNRLACDCARCFALRLLQNHIF